MTIPSGPGNLDLQCTFLLDLETTALCCTASMGLLMAEEVHARGLRGRLGLRKVILGAERTMYLPSVGLCLGLAAFQPAHAGEKVWISLGDAALAQLQKHRPAARAVAAHKAGSKTPASARGMGKIVRWPCIIS